MKRSIFLTTLICLGGILSSAMAGPASSSDEQALKKIEDQWAEAYIKRDSSFAERMTTADFSIVGPDGNSATRAEYVKDMASGPTIFSEFKMEEVKVRTYGDTAVVVGIANVKAKSGNEDLSGRYSYTDVFVKENGEWKLAAAQVTPVAKK